MVIDYRFLILILLSNTHEISNTSFFFNWRYRPYYAGYPLFKKGNSLRPKFIMPQKKSFHSIVQAQPYIRKFIIQRFCFFINQRFKAGEIWLCNWPASQPADFAN